MFGPNSFASLENACEAFISNTWWLFNKFSIFIFVLPFLPFYLSNAQLFFWARLDFRSAQKGGSPGLSNFEVWRADAISYWYFKSFHEMSYNLRHFMILSSYFLHFLRKIWTKRGCFPPTMREYKRMKFHGEKKWMKFRKVSSPLNLMKLLDEISGNLIWNFAMKFDHEVSLQPWLGAAGWFFNCWPAGPPNLPPSAVGVQKPVKPLRERILATRPSKQLNRVTCWA